MTILVSDIQHPSYKQTSSQCGIKDLNNKLYDWTLNNNMNVGHYEKYSGRHHTTSNSFVFTTEMDVGHLKHVL